MYQVRDRILRIILGALFASVLLVLGAGCKKQQANEPAKESVKPEKSAAPVVDSPKISLDTIPFEPFVGDALLRDLSIEIDTVKAPEVQRDSTGAISYVKPGMVDSMLLVAQRIMFERQLDSLKSLYNTSVQAKSMLKDSLDISRSEYSSTVAGMERQKTIDDSTELQRVSKVARMVENMKPMEAAALIDKLPPKFAAHVIVKLKDRQSGKVLAALQPEKASQIALLIKSGDYLKRDEEKSTTTKSAGSSKKASGK
ncbi:MAG: hypothetical protein OEM52_13335 [bacterium]|nr:hypothetical protein [bacterium]